MEKSELKNEMRFNFLMLFLKAAFIAAMVISLMNSKG